MIDRKQILGDIIKVLDTLAANGYIVGKLEVDFDYKSKTRKIQIHYDTERTDDEIIRKTKVIK